MSNNQQKGQHDRPTKRGRRDEGQTTASRTDGGNGVTCIVAVEHEGEVWVGGDSCFIDDSRDAGLTTSPKVFRKGTERGWMVLGYSGGFRAQQVIQYGLVMPDHPSHMRAEEWLCRDFANAVRAACRVGGVMQSKEGIDTLDGVACIVGYLGAAYVMEPDFGFVRRSVGYEAIGCGAKYAMGNLFVSQEDPPEARVRRALEAAEANNAGVRGPFTIMCTR